MSQVRPEGERNNRDKMKKDQEIKTMPYFLTA